MSGMRWILIPGTLCNHRLFEPMLQFIDLDYFIVDYSKCETTTEFVQLLADTCKKHPKAISILGFSLGGYLMQYLLKAVEFELQSLVLVSAPFEQNNTLKKRQNIIRRIDDGVFNIETDAKFDGYYDPKGPYARRTHKAMKHMAAEMGTTVFRRHLSLAINRPSVLNSKQISCPTLIVSGSQDWVIPVRNQTEWLDCARVGFHKIIPCGHMVPLEAPNGLADAIRTFQKDFV